MEVTAYFAHIESEEYSDDLILDYNHAGKIVGMDIQHASRYAEQMTRAMQQTA
jgi:uncharacterized protein YuzE